MSATAFNCPHCGALAKQFWFKLNAEALKDDVLPFTLTEAEAQKFGDGIDDRAEREKLELWAQRVAKKLPFFEESHRRDPYSYTVYNTALSKCFNCKDIALWISDRLVFPELNEVPAPNVDLPDEVKHDYREAAAIVDKSPRGSAALLRLAIQKLVISLGCNGNNLNSDIGTLVSRGLDSRIQQALDVVRVVGNNAVHPGELDVKDDAGTAQKLFELTNLIADVMISQPKHIASLYNSLPEGARAAVAKRDKAEAGAK